MSAVDGARSPWRGRGDGVDGGVRAARREGLRQLGRAVAVSMSQRARSGVEGSPSWMSPRLARVVGRRPGGVDWSAPQSRATTDWFVKVGGVLMRDLADDPDLQGLLPPSVRSQQMVQGFESALRARSSLLGRLPAPPPVAVTGQGVAR